MRSDALTAVEALDPYLPAFARASDGMEEDGLAWEALWAEPVLRAIAYLGVPDRFNPYPFAGAGLGPDCPSDLHLAIIERLARGGASALMALPASALSTRAVLTLGTEAQIARFFVPFTQGPAWTFFAVTEPACGTDAGRAETRLEDGRITGTKTLVGAASIAQRGLVLVRDAESGQLKLAILQDGANGSSFRTRRLPMTGLHGAGLTELTFEDHPIGPEDILGAGSRMPAMMALAGVFEKHRPMVGAMALGLTRAILDMMANAAEEATAPLALDHARLCQEMVALGQAFDRGEVHAHTISQFKRAAVALADRARMAALTHTPGQVVASPRLRRLIRDAGAFEYMEGATNIHLLTGFRAYVSERQAAHAAS